MLVSLGRQGAATDDVVDVLLECHGRIRAMTALARRLADARAEPDDQVRDAAARVARYFRESLPLHVLDEEHDLEPMLRGASPAVDDALIAMDADHRDHAAGVARLIAIGETLAAEPARLPSLAPDLAALAAGLEARFAAHLELEEQVLFPALRALPVERQQALLAAIRARRATPP